MGDCRCERPRALHRRIRRLHHGAASGMGRATAEVFAAEGAHVALSDLAAESVREVADDLVHRGLSAEAWTLDVSDADAIETVVAAAAARFGGIDIVVNNAG